MRDKKALVCPHGYTLDCYCDQIGCPIYEAPTYYGRNKREVFADARRDGWKFHKDGTATCKNCQ